MYYFDVQNCTYPSITGSVKTECMDLIRPYIKSFSTIFGRKLEAFWTTKSTFGYVLCDFLPEEFKGTRLVGKGAKRLFEYIKDDVEYVILTEKSDRLSYVTKMHKKKVLVLHIGHFRWFMKTFSNQKNAVKLLLNKFEGDEADIILKWFRSSVGEMQIEQVKQVTSDAKDLSEDAIIRAVNKNPSIMVKFAEEIEHVGLEIVESDEFSSAMRHIIHMISTKKIDKIQELLDVLKHEDAESIGQLNEHLKNVTLDSLNNMISLTLQKIEALNKFKSMLDNEETYEVPGHGSSSVHEFLEDNPSFMGKKYELYKSEKRMKDIIKKNLPQKIALLRPDFVLLTRLSGNDGAVLEIKKPSVELTVEFVQKVLDYKKILKEYMPNITNWNPILVGKKMSKDLTSRREDYNLEIKTYVELYSECENDLNEFLKIYKERKKEISPKGKDNSS